MKMCNHKHENGESALKLLPNSKNKFLGVLKPKRLAICVLCGENINLTEEEYNDMIEKGV